MYKKQSLVFLSFIFVVQLAHGCAQPAPKPSEPPELPKPVAKGPTEKTYPEEFDRVWENVIAVLTERGLSEHPHGKMSASKDSGKITTPVFRYFKIFSAKPVQERQYRDSYTVTVASEAKTKADEAKAKAEEAAGKLEEAKDKPEEEAKVLKEEIGRASCRARV